MSKVMTKKELVAELKRLGWKHSRGKGWFSPHHKRAFQGISLREAGSLEMLSCEELSSKDLF